MHLLVTRKTIDTLTIRYLISFRVSHTKATLVGTSVQIPITNGRLNLGTWQGICKSLNFNT